MQIPRGVEQIIVRQQLMGKGLTAKLLRTHGREQWGWRLTQLKVMKAQ